MYEMENLYQVLPVELTNLILEYQGYHTWRNGKYMCRLDLNSNKYQVIKQKPMVKKDEQGNYKTNFTKMTRKLCSKYVIYTAIYTNKIHWFMDIDYWNPLSNKGIKNPSYKNIHYVFGHNEQRHLPGNTWYKKTLL